MCFFGGCSWDSSGKLAVGSGEKNNCFLEWVLDGAVKTMKAGGGFMLRLSLEYFFVSHLEVLHDYQPTQIPHESV